MFAGSIANAARGLDRLRAHVETAGRSEFREGVAETIEAWRALGGTHATVFSTWMGFTTVKEHLAYAEQIRALLV